MLHARCLLRVVLAATFLAANAAAQINSGMITGIVTDPQKAVVPNAKVEVVEDSTKFSNSATTNGSGEFTVPYLKAGVQKEEACSIDLRGGGIGADRRDYGAGRCVPGIAHQGAVWAGPVREVLRSRGERSHVVRTRAILPSGVLGDVGNRVDSSRADVTHLRASDHALQEHCVVQGVLGDVGDRVDGRRTDSALHRGGFTLQLVGRSGDLYLGRYGRKPSISSIVTRIKSSLTTMFRIA